MPRVFYVLPSQSSLSLWAAAPSSITYSRCRPLLRQVCFSWKASYRPERSFGGEEHWVGTEGKFRHSCPVDATLQRLNKQILTSQLTK